MHAELKDTQTHRPKIKNRYLAILVAIVIFIYDVFKTVTTVLGVAFLIRFFLIQPFYVSGQSMEPNFRNNQYIIVDQISYKVRSPKRGDVVVFKYPRNIAFSFIKRIIGLPGETVNISNGEVTIYNDANPNGITLEEDYITSRTPMQSNLKLGDDEYFVLGDNRPNSSDSRTWGALPRHLIVGRVWVVLYPFEDFKSIKKPAYGNGL